MIQIGGGGGAATPAGSDTQVQFHDGGAFGGDAGLVYNKTTDTLTVGKQLLIAAGTATASTPVMDLSQTWNNGAVSFTGMVLNITDTASQAVSYSLNVQLGGAMRFSVRKDGVVYVHTAVNLNGTNLWSNGNEPYMSNSVGNINQFNSGGGLLSAGNGSFGFSSNATSALVAADVSLFRDAASTLAQRVGTAAQTFRVYNTYTDASNYERASLGWVGNVFTIQAENAGTGSNRAVNVVGKGNVTLTSTLAAIQFVTSSSTRWVVEAAGNFVSIADNALDIGAASANRPRSVYAGTRILATGSTAVIGYGTGAGGAVTQTISRTTGVTLNKAAGAITLVSAAGSATWQSFTVTNSTVAATDTVVVNQQSGTDLYMIHVTAVGAGSFQITFATTGGTTTEQPVFNYAVVKSVAA